MVKGLCLLVLLILIMMPFVLSENEVNTQITLKAEPNSKVFLGIKDQASMRTIGSFNTSVDADGEKVFNFESAPRMLAFVVNVYEGGSLIETRDFNGFIAGSPALLDMNAEVQEEVNETAEAVNETEENLTAEAGLTGSAISEVKIDLKIIYYVIGGILFVGLIAFVVYTTIQRRKTPGSYTVTKLSEKLSRERGEEEKISYGGDKDIKEAEKKIMEMQKEIDKLKMIKEAERRLDEAKRDLDRLRSR